MSQNIGCDPWKGVRRRRGKKKLPLKVMRMMMMMITIGALIWRISLNAQILTNDISPPLTL